jgi:putative oxidoreductase
MDKWNMVLNNTGTAVLRIVTGVVFVAHGWRKVMAGFDTVSQAFESMGIPTSLVSAILVAFVELLGGALLIVGFKTRFAVIPLGATMAVAMFVVHLKGGFFLPQGYEYTLVLLASLVTLGLLGPGALSIDRLLRKKTAPAAPAEEVPATEERGEEDATSQTIKREGPESA